MSTPEEKADLDIRFVLSRDPAPGDRALVAAHGMSALPPLARLLLEDRPIREAERCEALLKAVLGSLFSNGVSGAQARDIAAFQKQIGFILKYKSYTIKAATPLGYSIFLQNHRQGFSFQQHVTHKTEVFHILQPLPGGFVFLCSFDEWDGVYDPDAFAAWLSGGADPRYDAFCFTPEPGDVFVIDKLRVVHTVVGCILEEFATVSTDMVDRLHDQNRGRAIPSEFSRVFADQQLAAVAPPSSHRQVFMKEQGGGIQALESESCAGGNVTHLTCTSMNIAWHEVQPGAAGDLFDMGGRAASLYVTAGSGRLLIGEPGELEAPHPPGLDIAKGDLLMIAPGMRFGFVNTGADTLNVSEHRLPPAVAFEAE